MIPRCCPGALLHIWHGLGTDLRKGWLQCWKNGCWLGVTVDGSEILDDLQMRETPCK